MAANDDPPFEYQDEEELLRFVAARLAECGDDIETRYSEVFQNIVRTTNLSGSSWRRLASVFIYGYRVSVQSLFSGSNPLITYCTSEEVISQAEAVVLSYMNESYSHDLMSTDAEVTNPITCPSALAGYSRNLRETEAHKVGRYFYGVNNKASVTQSELNHMIKCLNLKKDTKLSYHPFCSIVRRFLVKVSWYSLLNLFKFSYLCAKHLCLGGYKDQMKGIISHLCRLIASKGTCEYNNSPADWIARQGGWKAAMQSNWDYHEVKMCAISQSVMPLVNDVIKSVTDNDYDRVSLHLRMCPADLRVRALMSCHPEVLHQLFAQCSSTDEVCGILDHFTEAEKMHLSFELNQKGESLLHVTMCNSDTIGTCLVSLLLAGKSAKERHKLIFIQNDSGDTILHSLVDRMRGAKLLIHLLESLSSYKKQKLIFIQNHVGKTAFHVACECVAKLHMPDDGESIPSGVIQDRVTLYLELVKAILENTPQSHRVDLIMQQDRSGQSALDVLTRWDDHWLPYDLLDTKDVVTWKDHESGEPFLYQIAKKRYTSHFQRLWRRLDSASKTQCLNLKEPLLSGVLCAKLEKFVQWDQDQDGYYYMLHPPAVIIFCSTHNRDGALDELKAMTDAFPTFRVSPIVLQDPTEMDIHNTIREAQNIPDLSGLIVISMSHGQAGVIEAADGSVYIQDVLYTICSPVIGSIPKVLIVQACQITERAIQGMIIPHRSNSDPRPPRPQQPTPQQITASHQAQHSEQQIVNHTDFDDRNLAKFVVKHRHVAVIMATAHGDLADRLVLIPKLARHLKQNGGYICEAFVKTNKEMEREVPEQVPIFISSLTDKFCLGHVFEPESNVGSCATM